MKKQISPRTLRVITTVLVLTTLCFGLGCANVLSGFNYFFKGAQVEGPHNEVLKEKRVAVVCRSASSEAFVNPDIPQRAARILSDRLGRKVDDIEIVDQGLVNDFLDNNFYSDFIDVGEAVDADYVLGIEIENFTIHASSSTTLYQGVAGIHYEVIDCNTGESLVRDALPDITYPQNAPMQASEMNSYSFTEEFLGVLCFHLGKNFHPYNPQDEFAFTADVINR
jgi:hypothetical protein